MVKITDIVPGSYAEKCGVKAGDTLVSINGNAVRDVLDYRFYVCEKKLAVTVSRDGTERKFSIIKDEYDDIGLEFETFLMDKKHSARRCAPRPC